MICKGFSLILLTFCLNLSQALGTIFFYRNDSTDNIVHQLFSSDLGMGIALPDEGIWAYISVAEPENACADVEPAPAYPSPQYASYALVSSSSVFYNCSIGEKVTNLAEAGYDGAVLYFDKDPQDEGEEPEIKFKRFKQESAANDAPPLYNMTIVFLTEDDGLEVKTKYNSEQGYVAFILNKTKDSRPSYNWKTWAVGIGLCLLALLILFVLKRFLDSKKGSKFV